MNDPQNLKPYYRASRKQLIKIYCLAGFSVLWLLLMGYLAHSAFFHMHVDGAPEVLADFGDRLGMAIFILVIALAFPVGMWVYLTCYVRRADFSPQYGVMVYQTLNPLGRNVWLDGEGADNMVYHEGKLDLMGDLRNPAIIVPKVHAPWISNRVKGKRCSLIIDIQGEFHDV